MAAFDVQAAIAEFVADPARVSLELPHMTTGQRRHTKTVAEQYPELRCESFGFGKERQLHLFKRCTLEAGREAHVAPATARAEIAPTGSHHGTPQDISSDSAPAPSSSEPELPEWDVLQVRNTFIHIKGGAADERVVQSMPHGMFKQCVLAESCCNAAADGASTPPSEPEAEPVCSPTRATPARQCAPFGLGALVVVEGLTKCPGFNGLSAVVQGWDEAASRYSILIVSAESGCQQAKVKHENLRLLMPCP